MERRLQAIEDRLNKELEITWLISKYEGAEVTREEIEEAKRQYRQQYPNKTGIAVLDFCHLAKEGANNRGSGIA